MKRAIHRRRGRSRFKPAPRGKPMRLSIDGWEISYFEPTYGTRKFTVATHPELAAAKKWLDAGGYSYSTRELR